MRAYSKRLLAIAVAVTIATMVTGGALAADGIKVGFCSR